MSLSVLVSLCGLAATLVVLLVGVGVAWGTLRTQIAHEKETREISEKRASEEQARRDRESATCKADCLSKIDSQKNSSVNRIEDLVLAVREQSSLILEQTRHIGLLENRITKLEAQFEALRDRT